MFKKYPLRYILIFYLRYSSRLGRFIAQKMGRYKYGEHYCIYCSIRKIRIVIPPAASIIPSAIENLKYMQQRERKARGQ